MRRLLHPYLSACCVCCVCGFLVTSCAAQSTPKAPASDNTAAVERALGLAAKGRCREALPRLKNGTARLGDKQQKYRVAMATARCAMSLDQTETAVYALLLLKREFP